MLKPDYCTPNSPYYILAHGRRGRGVEGGPQTEEALVLGVDVVDDPDALHQVHVSAMIGYALSRAAADVVFFDRYLIHHVYDLAQAAEAHRAMEASEHFGKLVLRVASE